MVEKILIMTEMPTSNGVNPVQLVLSGISVPGKTGRLDQMLSNSRLTMPFWRLRRCGIMRATAEREPSNPEPFANVDISFPAVFELSVAAVT